MRQFVPRGELRSTLSLTTEQNGDYLSTPNTGRFSLGMTPLSIVQETVWVPWSLWTVCGKSRLPPGIVPATVQAVTSRYND